MKIAKLILGENYVVGEHFFQLGQEVEVTDAMAAELAEYKIVDYDPDVRTFREIPYFKITDSVKPTKVKKETE